MFERLDQPARDVMAAAHDHALALGDPSIATEHLLLALATSNEVTARLLADAGCPAERLRAGTPARSRPVPQDDHARLLAGLGIDLAAVRARAEQTFGADALHHAAAAVRPRRRRPSLWSHVSCGTPQPPRRCDSPLAGRTLGVIPRVKRLLQRAELGARPAPVTPARLLLALLEGNEPACERLDALGVDVEGLTRRVRSIVASGAEQRRAG